MGKLYTWGESNSGRLGNGTTSPDISTPTQIGSDTDWDIIKPGKQWTVAIKDGKLFTWGSASNGYLGNGTTTPDVTTPTQIGSDTDWEDIDTVRATSTTGTQTWAVKGGKLYAWGLGQGTSPVQIGSDTDWAKVYAAGDNHRGALKTDGTLWTWGNGSNGKLGHGNTSNQANPTQVGSDSDWEMVSGGATHFVAIKDGKLFTWGDAANGRLGNGTTTPDVTTPTQIGSDTDWTWVHAGTSHTLAIRDGKLYAWGLNLNGQLGVGNTTDQTSLTQVGSDTDWIMASGGRLSSYGIKGGKLYSWGNPQNGRLGNGNTASTPLIDAPVEINSNTTWTSVYGVQDHAAAIESVNVAPANTAAPTVSGTAKVGETLTTTDGTWTGTPLPTYAYKWQVSDDGSTSWSDISGATSSTFTITSSQAGKYLRSHVTATNSEGSATATSTASSQVVEDPAIDTPTISGTAKVGQVLTASASATAGVPSPSISYQWQSASTSGGSYSNISGANSSTYTLTSSEAGKYIKVEATATNSEGTASELSAASSQVVEDPAIDTPTISGTAKVGQVLTASASATAGVPSPSISYQWQSSTDNATWTNISGATSSTLVLSGDEVGKIIRVEATATNSEGSDSKTSTETTPVVQDPVVSTPSISGTTKVGQTLTTSATATEGFPIPSVSYQWKRSNTLNGIYANILDATSSSYTLTSIDLGKYIKVEATASNIDGSDSQLSTAVGPITQDTPPPPEEGVKATGAITGALIAIRRF